MRFSVGEIGLLLLDIVEQLRRRLLPMNETLPRSRRDPSASLRFPPPGPSLFATPVTEHSRPAAMSRSRADSTFHVVPRKWRSESGDCSAT